MLPNTIYAIGGFSNPKELTGTIEKFDAEAQAWSPVAITEGSGYILANQFCVSIAPGIFNLIGGTNGKTAFDSIAVFNTEKNELTLAPHKLLEKRSAPKCFKTSTHITVFGGTRRSLTCETWPIGDEATTIHTAYSI